MYEFKKSPSEYGQPMDRGSWLLHPDFHLPILCCPTCGSLGTLRTHSVAADGAVSPSIVCTGTHPQGGACLFHEMGKLLDWRTP
jgi:hypothetical protein